MYDFAVLWEWIAFAVRWLHVITAIAWIGSSFYFIALDLGLNRNIPGPADGEEWQVHGGGFYHIQKYLVAPPEMPEHLTWFKWESYATWLSGFALLAVVYWAGAEFFMIDPAKMSLATWQAVLISTAFLIGGWVGYDLLCKSRLSESPTTVMVILFLGIVVSSWALNEIFTGRAALIMLGAMTATLMTANVAHIIIPNQRIVVADLKAGRKPDPKYGKIAKLRSTHNNYLTLPVIFLMLSNHYPLAFATEYAWIIGALVFLMGVTIRHFFNSMHARQGRPYWTWGVTAAIFVVIAWLSSVGTPGEEERSELTAAEMRFASAAGFETAYQHVIGNCSMCHAREPVWDGVLWAPKGVILETQADVARHARSVYLQAGISHAMPPAGAFAMPEAQRADIARWYRAAVAGN